jgi:hypothetical protein
MKFLMDDLHVIAVIICEIREKLFNQKLLFNFAFL